MPEDEVRRPLLFGMSNGGKFEPVGEIGEMPTITSDANDEPYIDPTVFEEFSATMEADLEEFGDALAKLGNVNTEAERAVAVILEHLVSLYRHRYVWQYKSERKGTRKPRNRWHNVRVRTVIPDVDVESCGDNTFAVRWKVR